MVFQPWLLPEKDGQMERDYEYSSAVYESDLQPCRGSDKSAGDPHAGPSWARKPETGKFPVIYDRRVAASRLSALWRLRSMG